MNLLMVEFGEFGELGERYTALAFNKFCLTFFLWEHVKNIKRQLRARNCYLAF